MPKCPTTGCYMRITGFQRICRACMLDLKIEREDKRRHSRPAAAKQVVFRPMLPISEKTLRNKGVRVGHAKLAVYSGQVVLECSTGHKHIVGVEQVEAIRGTSCPWCGASIAEADAQESAA